MRAFMYSLRASKKKIKIHWSLEEGVRPSVRTYQDMYKMLKPKERRLTLNSLFKRKRVESAMPTSRDNKSSDPAFYIQLLNYYYVFCKLYSTVF